MKRPQLTTKILIVLLIGGAGCSHDVSKYKPFSEQVGKTAILQRPAYLWKIGPGIHHYESITLYRDVILSENDSGVEGQMIQQLPAGTAIQLEAAKSWYLLGTSRFHALGRAIDPGGGKPIEFEYVWGVFGYLFHAPWEPGEYKPRFVGNSVEIYATDMRSE